jgi:hypothetical protein
MIFRVVRVFRGLGTFEKSVSGMAATGSSFTANTGG